MNRKSKLGLLTHFLAMSGGLPSAKPKRKMESCHFCESRQEDHTKIVADGSKWLWACEFCLKKNKKLITKET